MEHDTHPPERTAGSDEPAVIELGPSLRRRWLLAVAGLAVAIPAVGLVSYGVANAEDEAPADEATALVGAQLEAGAEGEDCEVQPPTPEELAEWQADEDALSAYLDERGISYTWETDPDGVRYVIVDENDDAAMQAVDEFWAERYPIDPEELAELQAEEEELAAFLDERGISYTWETDPDGMRYVIVDENDDAAMQAVDEFWAEKYPLTPDEIAELQADEDALATFLDERGIAYTREASPDGVTYTVWDYEDEAANQAVDEFYAERYPEDESCIVFEAEAENEG